jgi:nucleoside-diphosphate-sugar epimerase
VHDAHKQGIIQFFECDVRNEIDLPIVDVDFIFNYAAVHREPGHEAFEYYETNIRGAETVIDFATKINCQNIFFTSSIAPYGHSDSARDESSKVVPYSPYGGSKLVAEKIHYGWHSVSPDERTLVIVRPGVIYGPHEDGNVPRLRDALKKRMFCYVGNKDVRKAGGYVKELVSSIFWLIEHLDNTDRKYALYNFSNKTPPTLEEYVTPICSVLEEKIIVPTLPYNLVLIISRAIHFTSKLFGIKHPVHPQRIKKLRVNNIIIPNYLITQGYHFKYDLKSSMLDWKKDTPEEW